ncbi:hypothetical protein BJV74DRAFT_887314 [Russula compacta]|nr:hypothetical protein BJV74DRAFT_887314 [Russula compacta]
MLEHSPSLPLVIDHADEGREITAEDEEGIMLALQYRGRIRRIRLWMPISKLQKLIMAIDDEFPMLLYLYIRPATNNNVGLILPKTFRAPHLRNLVLFNFAFPIGSPLLTTVLGLVTLSLQRIPRSTHFYPNELLQQLSLMPQLEALWIDFRSGRDVEMQLLDAMIMTHVTLPNLRWFVFYGVSAYLEALLARMTTPLLEKFQIQFPDQPTFSVPHLPEFISAAGNLKLSSAATARVGFSTWGVWVWVYPHAVAKTYSLEMAIKCGHLDRQVASAAQLFSPLEAVFSAVEGLSFGYWRHSMSWVWNNEADRTEWRELFRSFSNVKRLRVDDGLITQLSDSLRLEDGESPMDVLPELKGLSYPASGGNAFTSFIADRKKAGHPVTLYRH